MNKFAMTVAATFLPGVAGAHPSHGSDTSFGLVHYVSDPFHIGLTAAAILVVLAVRQTMLRRHSLTQRRQ